MGFIKLIPYVHISYLNLVLADVVKHGNWCFDDLATPIPTSVKNVLTGLHLPLPSVTNVGPSWHWVSASSKEYSTKSAYLWLAKQHLNWTDNDNWSWLWKLFIPKKIRFMLWLPMLFLPMFFDIEEGWLQMIFVKDVIYLQRISFIAFGAAQKLEWFGIFLILLCILCQTALPLVSGLGVV
ncbi:hypothetical protein PIB30_092833 [Stylosanthes scabra]|uniref:Reverse transcriptase zinc-binding domain-containing protein n=1 Tax=Stylosanthes scabra TaxID=79078 RepID=A0ABU6RUY2_9FABA|nr:hypothetical protein [Stylosanthes scabra]